MAESRICRTCHEEFTVKRTPHGYVDQCDDCGRLEEADQDTRRHVGIIGGAGINKSNAIQVVKNPSRALAAKVKGHNGGRFGANLPLGQKE